MWKVDNSIKFTEEQENEIVDMYVNQHIGCPKIGKHFGVSITPIYRILDKHGISRKAGSTSRKYALNENYFDEIDTPNKAYILGFLYADGNNFPKKQTIKLSLQDIDKEILEKIRLEIGSEKQLVFYEQSKRRDKDNDYHYCDMYSLEFYSAHICSQLTNLGCVPNKSLVLKFPYFLNQDLYRHFIRGYFDGDGSLCNHFTKDGKFQPLITFTSTEDVCIHFQHIFRALIGIGGGGIYDCSSHNGITKVLSISGVTQCRLLLNWLYEDADLYMERKYKKYLELLDILQNKSQAA